MIRNEPTTRQDWLTMSVWHNPERVWIVHIGLFQDRLWVVMKLVNVERLKSRLFLGQLWGPMCALHPYLPRNLHRSFFRISTLLSTRTSLVYYKWIKSYLPSGFVLKSPSIVWNSFKTWNSWFKIFTLAYNPNFDLFICHFVAQLKYMTR